MNKSVNLWLKVKDKEIDELVSIIQQGCVILAGAGISYNCFPLASDLKHLIAKTLIDNAVGIKKNEYKTFMSKHPWNDFPLETVLAWINDIIGQGALDAILAVFKNGRPSFYHKLFALCLKKKYFHSIFTTNFDELLEQACNELKVKFDRYISGSYRKNIHNGPMIVKLHGTISQPMTILAVLKEIYRSRNSHAIQYLRNLVSKKHLIVVGYSGYDLIDIMPTLMLSDIYKCFWLIHVPEGEKVEKIVKNNNAIILRYFSNLSRNRNFRILPVDSNKVFMKVSKRLNLSIENDEDVDNENITLKKFDSKVKKKPVQTWEIIDLFNVLDRTPADRIAKYLNDSDPMAHYTYNDNKWRLFASLSDEKTKRMSAENWRTYGNTMLRNPEIDNNNYWFRSALYRARELFKTIGCEKEAHEINIKLALNPAPDISIAEFSDVEKSLKKGPDDLKLRITLEKVKRLIKDKEYFEAFELLVQCKDQVLNLDDIEITLFYDGLVIGVLSYIQIYGSYVREFEKKWGWNNWLESFIESSRRYLFNDTCGVKGKFDRQSIIAATARLLLHVYGKDASKFIENNEEYYISNSENDLYRYLKHCEKSGITREIFENFKNES